MYGSYIGNYMRRLAAINNEWLLPAMSNNYGSPKSINKDFRPFIANYLSSASDLAILCNVYNIKPRFCVDRNGHMALWLDCGKGFDLENYSPVSISPSLIEILKKKLPLMKLDNNALISEADYVISISKGKSKELSDMDELYIYSAEKGNSFKPFLANMPLLNLSWKYNPYTFSYIYKYYGDIGSIYLLFKKEKGRLELSGICKREVL